MTLGNVPSSRLAAIQSGLLKALMGLAGLTSGAAFATGDLPGGPAVNQLNMHPPVTAIAVEQNWLHWFMLILCTVIFVVVFGVMFYSIWKHRRSVGHQAQELPEPIWVELGWTIVPFLIVIGMALPATKVLVAQKDTTNAEVTIKATGMQWQWGYDYIKGEGEGIGFISRLDPSHRVTSNAGTGPKPDDYLLKVDNPLVVPVGQKIRVITTANDVIHSWMIPAFGVKQDAIPGFVRDTWFRAEKEGMYYGQCVELCGKEHAYMPINVKVVSAAEYTTWVNEQQKIMAAKADDPSKVWELTALVERGATVYAANCAACHQASGKGAGPIKALDGSAIVLNKDHKEVISSLLNGRGNGAMPAWKSLSDTEIAAVITYTKNSWSNQSGDFVQPAAVQAARNN